ncbi:murein L,D-transpeptidase catalytic domain family protein [Arcticibacter sp. MXS-1]|uniref:murein L,D-transpeptidase catalytic domain family protein n=1 Tax=Arcticibacter sp. MXS-1 TaxID=3341726 RepID=UPI0035A8AE35
MRKRILRGTAYVLLALSIPALNWSLKDDSSAVVAKTIRDTSLISDSAITVKEVSAAEAYVDYVKNIYSSAALASSGLDFDVFRKAVTGYLNFRTTGLVSTDKQVISIVDFTQPSTKKRLWIVDLLNKKLLFNTLVAHGQGSGDNYATSFSNTSESHQSSLGFYITSNTYQGKHGLSLKLNGMDKGYNTNALSRAVVVHGAEYVSQDFVNQHGRLGRSYGCPAVPVELTPAIINTIKGRTALFINGPSATKYASSYLNEESAASQFGSRQLLAGS